MATPKYSKLKTLKSIDDVKLQLGDSSLGGLNADNVFVNFEDAVILTGKEDAETLNKLLSNNIRTVLFSNCFLSEEFYKKVASLIKGRKINVLFSVNEDSKNSDCIFNEKETRALANNVNIFLSNGIDAQIYSEFNAQIYPLERVLDANRKIYSWAKLINDAKVDGRELSPLEKYLYAYLTISTYFDYTIEGENEPPSVSRALINVLTGDKIVCVGFAEMLSSVLNMVGVPCIRGSVIIGDTNMIKHAVCFPYINDERYNCNGIVYSDPTSSSLIFSMVDLKDFNSVVERVKFYKEGLEPYGKKWLLEEYLQSIRGFSEEDYSLIKRLIYESARAPKLQLTEKILGSGDYNIFEGIVNKVLEDKNLTQEGISFVMQYNFRNIEAFKREARRTYLQTKLSSSPDRCLQDTVKRMLKNPQRSVYRTISEIDSSITKLSTSVKFSEEAFKNVFIAMGKTEETAKRYSSAFIKKTLEELILNINYKKIAYKFNFDGDTNNFFIQQIKRQQSALEKGEDVLPITYEEAAKANHDARIDYSLGKISKEAYEETERKLDSMTDISFDAKEAKKFIKEKIRIEVMDKDASKE